MPRGRKKGSVNKPKHQKAGVKGGQTTASEYGPEFYKELGSLGGSSDDSRR